MSGTAKIQDGVYFAVKPTGNVVGSLQSGPKLYVYKGTAVVRAGKDGTVFRVKLGQYGMVVERVHGPPVVFEAKTFFLNERHELPPPEEEERCRYCNAVTWACQGTCLG